MAYSPTPPEKFKKLRAWDIGIEETRGAPRPWIFEREEARRRRRALALARFRERLAKFMPSRTHR